MQRKNQMNILNHSAFDLESEIKACFNLIEFRVVLYILESF